MPQVKMSAGKFRGFKVLADGDGRFRMMAIDQRGSLRRMLSKVLDPDEVGHDDLRTVKKSVVKVLSPYSSATLTDPVYGYPGCLGYIPKDVGLLLAYEETGYTKAGEGGHERRSSLIEGWSARKAKRAGADAVKLLIYWRPEASDETLEHQSSLVRKVGKECEEVDLPFVLELVSYPLLKDELPGGTSRPTPAFAKRKPEIVLRTVQEFSKPEYKADLLKIEFPADLKYTEEYCHGAFDGEKRRALYDLDEVEDFCRMVDEACVVPWVILSAGVEVEEFLANVELASEAGASGFLGGRAIWQGCTKFYPDVEAMEKWLATSGADNFRRLREASRNAVPWYEHRRFGGYPNVLLAGGGGEWYRNYEGL